MQRRGPYKRLFADTFTVSANAKVSENDSLFEAASAAVKDEVGIMIAPDRFTQVGKRNGYHNRFISYDFYAFDHEEESRLKAAFEGAPRIYSGVYFKYDARKQSVCIFSVNPLMDRKLIKELADSFTHASGIPYIYPVFDDDTNFLVTCRLTSEEEAAVNSIIVQKREAKRNSIEALAVASQRKDLPAHLKKVDSDDMVFRSWLEVGEDFKKDPLEFALDLTSPYFSYPEVWPDHFNLRYPLLISADDELARLIEVSGGKGSNTYYLRRLSKTSKRFIVPQTHILTSFAYKILVLENPDIFPLIKQLDLEKDDIAIKKVSSEIRNRIMSIEIPGSLIEDVLKVFDSLGRDVSVRSSANVEDLKENSAAGEADSFLHLKDIDSVLRAIKGVWASLFSDGFVTYRINNRFHHKDSRMPVLIQRFLEPKAAGVATSIFPGTQPRPAYNISAQPGVGEGVVQGMGLSDKWLVGILGDVILERFIARKTYRVAAGENGGTCGETIDSLEPCLDDEEVLRLARAVRDIHCFYRRQGLAQNVDVEFVVDNNGQVHIVQTRAESFKQMAVETGRVIFKVKTVDELNLSPATEHIRLTSTDALVANPGAISGRLLVLPKGRPEDAEPEAILVTQHTNNEWNDVFARLNGIITTDGGDTSHAAKNSRSINIPCVVSATGAIERLMQWNGKLVTFDAGRKTVYLGEVPVTERENMVDLWVADHDEMEEIHRNREAHELFRPWSLNFSKRPEIFKQDFEGHWRRRSAVYGYFQLDLYYHAWDRLTQYLNERFVDRRPWELRPQEREIRSRSLYHKITENDLDSIFYFLADIREGCVNDFYRLYEDRDKGLKDFDQYTAGLKGLTRENVEHVVDGLILVFVWMHMAYWLNAAVDTLFVFDQFKYIRREWHEMVKNMSIAGLPKSKQADLSRNKDCELYSMLERIRSDEGLANVFSNKDTEGLKQDMKVRFPQVLTEVDSWSTKYKKTKEHFDLLCDTDEYLKDLHLRLLNGSVFPAEIFISFLEEWQGEAGRGIPVEEALNKLTATPIWPLLRSIARLYAAQKKVASWNSITDEEKGRRLLEVKPEEINSCIADVYIEMQAIINKRRKQSDALSETLKSLPNLFSVAMLSKLETTIRQDCHHVIVPIQRRIARFMLEVAEKFVGTVFERKEQIFSIGVEELIALLRESDPRYIGFTFHRIYMQNKAESDLTQDWAKGRRAAIDSYRESIEQAIGILRCQAKETTIERLRRYYAAEEKRLTARLERLQKIDHLLLLKERLATSDIKREALDADVLLVCGNSDLNVYEETLALYAQGKARTVILAGGHGRATIPLIKRALANGMEIMINENQTINIQDRDVLKDLDSLQQSEMPYPDFVKAVASKISCSEAQIMMQIIRVMAKRRGFSLREKDFYLENELNITKSNFSLSVPLIESIRNDLHLETSCPLRMAFIHRPLEYYRTKSTCCLFAPEWNRLNVSIEGYTIDFDIHDFKLDDAIEVLVTEMWRLLIYSTNNDGNPAYLASLPDDTWQAAYELVYSSMSDKLRAKLIDLNNNYLDKTGKVIFSSKNKIISRYSEQTARTVPDALRKLIDLVFDEIGVTQEPSSNEQAQKPNILPPALNGELNEEEKALLAKVASGNLQPTVVNQKDIQAVLDLLGDRHVDLDKGVSIILRDRIGALRVFWVATSPRSPPNATIIGNNVYIFAPSSEVLHLPLLAQALIHETVESQLNLYSASSENHILAERLTRQVLWPLIWESVKSLPVLVALS